MCLLANPDFDGHIAGDLSQSPASDQSPASLSAKAFRGLLLSHITDNGLWVRPHRLRWLHRLGTDRSSDHGSESGIDFLS
jgi:hypothetical protein